ncbi:MAG: YitT family protein [Flammeovirgaceae bacterium]|nr:YitT family protein [Flammeovirgaceae bacterium]
MDGGVMGISLLVNILSGINLSVLVFLINLPFVVIAYTQISKKFALKTPIAISLLAAMLAIRGGLFVA